jgi:perosamine synthetase
MNRLPITSPSFDQAEIANLQACLDSRWVTQGPWGRKFEEQFAARHQLKHALVTSSCTASLHLAATALGVGPGDEVIVPAFTWVTSAHCAEYVGAKVVFADIDPATFNLDPQAFVAAITPRTRAVVIVHLFGLAASMDELLAVARRHDLAIIEDAACAVGTTYDGTPVGGLGHIGCFSFHPRKIITTGEGGMVTTNHPRLAERVASLRNHGAAGHPGPGGPGKPYSMGEFNVLGFNLRLSDLQSAVGVAQMDKLDRLLDERRMRAEEYRRLLADVDLLQMPPTPGRCGHSYQSFVVRLRQGGRKRRNQIMEELDAVGIQTRAGTHAVHRLGYYAKKYDLRPGDFPHAAEAEDTSITLPLFPGMTDADQQRVVGTVKQALVRCG